tara:strand:+ start:3725 stop:6088 length:2364 start_codon:yes stop_codon:yes gene_type:complete
MQTTNFKIKDTDKNSDLDLKANFFKYFYFRKYFLLSLVFCLIIAFLYNRYSDQIVETSAMIKILDKQNTSLELPTADEIFSNSKINLENEIEVIKSYSILKKVVENQNLTISVKSVGSVKSVLTTDHPFKIISKISSDSIFKKTYNVKFKNNILRVVDIDEDKEFLFKNSSTYLERHTLPFEITVLRKSEWVDEGYEIEFHTIYDKVNELKESINVSQVGRNSDIISLIYNSTNYKYAQKVLNEIIKVFNDDGVKDRQLIHKRTIDFVNSRFIDLSFELDSIELDKQFYKSKNNLVNLLANSSITLNKSSEAEENLFENENQIYIVTSLLNSFNNINLELLPSNIGIESIEINSLIFSYNDLILEQRKLSSSAGKNHPSLITIKSLINENRNNILFSLKNYLSQLRTLNTTLSKEFDKLDNNVSKLPEKEKTLREIERNQNIKETLYLFLLQKREEAEVSYAITEPSIKVVEYAISNKIPIAPKRNIIYLFALIIGLFIPFLILYTIFLFDNKIHSRDDIIRFNENLNILGEIPFFESNDNEKVFSNSDDRSLISESYRMLMSNARYLESPEKKSHVILVTSSIKGEGKTLNALNLSLSYSSVGKKVLLIGCDLRNPQLHKYLDRDKNIPGLVDSLVDNKIDWKKNIIKPFEKNKSLDVLLSGPLPPNPLNLINNGNLNIILNDAKKQYDYIILDSAPTLLVADTKSLFKLADNIIFLARCNVTDKEILKHIESVSNENSASLGIVLNGVGERNSYGYSYNYQYGYNYKYSYNYGYGYGYGSEKEGS